MSIEQLPQGEKNSEKKITLGQLKLAAPTFLRGTSMEDFFDNAKMAVDKEENITKEGIENIRNMLHAAIKECKDEIVGDKLKRFLSFMEAY